MHVVIIGNGISGSSAARWLRKLGDAKITMISSESEHFYSRTALMYIYMGHMRYEDTKPYENWFWDKNRINILKAQVDSVDFKSKKLALSSGKSINYDVLIFALGSKWNKFGWPGQDLKGVGGMYSLQDLEKIENYSKNLKKAVIVGGGLIGIELAEMFHSRHIPVTFLVRESSFWNLVLPKEESEMISKHILDNGIDLKLDVNLEQIIGDDTGTVKEVIVKETQEKIPCGFVGLTAGVSPNVAFLKDTDLHVERGIVVNEFLETNIKDVYAIGDCAQQKNPSPGRRPIEAIWYTGRMMGETAAYNIMDKKVAYDPGIWFNSAKFFDIEYQVYGTVLTNPPENHEQLFWVNKHNNKSIRIIYDNLTNEVIGFNLMGIRYRHEVCEKWLKEKTHIETVLRNLGMANFDPEFYKEYEQEIINIYNHKSGKTITLKTKRGLSKVLAFLSKKS